MMSILRSAPFERRESHVGCPRLNMSENRRRARSATCARLGRAAVTVLLTSCSGGSSVEDEAPPTVLTTFTVLADIAASVAGESLRVESITKIGAEIHGYEPTPSDIRRAARADLILDNGLGLEAWFARFVDGLDVPHVVVSEGIDPIDIVADEFAGKPNPHAWMSPTEVAVYVDNIVAAFSELDPSNAAAYQPEERHTVRNCRL